MKRIINLVIILAGLTVICGIEAKAQKAQRIQFAKGKSSATVKGNTGSAGIYYLLKAKSGQVLVLDLSPKANVGIKVETEGADGQQILLREEKGGHYEIGLEESGDFSIFVGSIKHKPTSFTLTVKVRKMKDI